MALLKMVGSQYDHAGEEMDEPLYFMPAPTTHIRLQGPGLG